jgi:class 3 adenylate cyclase/CHASE2 domain-containing sensor protein
LLSGPWADRLGGLSIDTLHWLRGQVLAPAVRPEIPLNIIAIDEATYRTPPFRDTPRVMWTQEIARVLNALGQADAKVIGLDLIFPTSVEKYLRGFDRAFLLALRGLARDNRVVLAMVQHSDAPIRPHPGQSFAVGHGRNIRIVNLLEDPDGIIRRVPLSFAVTGGNGETRRQTAFAAEIASRLAGAEATISDSGVLLLNGAPVPGSGGNALDLNFDTAADALTMYSFADLHACAEAERADFFRSQFAGKAVLLGLVLDVEDRKLTSARLTTENLLRATAPRCTDQPAVQAPATRDSLPGVFIHAAAIANILRGDALVVPSRGATAAVTLLITLAAAALAMLLSAPRGGGLLVASLLIWGVVCVVAFRAVLVLPMLQAAISAGLGFALIQGYRFTVADKDKRFLRRAFAFYLAPAVIDRLVEADRPPMLGGETREVSILFSDLASFTSISESLTPEALVDLLNTYLTAMTDIVEAHGGFVDKYIGDAIVAVFGAPLDDPAHAQQAVEAALDCRARLRDLRGQLSLPDNRELAARIGVNTGPTLVGNIGSQRRFNYTVIGDTVNLAARLEGANKAYATDILITAETAAACGPDIALREIDQVRVVGRAEPVAIFEPLDRAANIDAATRARLDRFAQALADLRSRLFEEAAAEFGDLADTGDQIAASLARRATALAAAPPGPDWDGVTDLEEK